MYVIYAYKNDFKLFLEGGWNRRWTFLYPMADWTGVCIAGSICTNDGIDWIRVGSFEYPEHGTVRVNVSLEKPTNIVAIGTVAEVPLPNTFRFRQNAEDFLVVG